MPGHYDVPLALGERTFISPEAVHRTGYHVWVYGERYWHRTLAGAERRMLAAQRWAMDIQIIEIATGHLVAGRPI